MDFVNFIFEFSEFYENIILVIKKLSAGIYGKWARRETAPDLWYYLLLPSAATLRDKKIASCDIVSHLA
jgi:hypothetical protein